jgi:hypothetical protein
MTGGERRMKWRVIILTGWVALSPLLATTALAGSPFLSHAPGFRAPEFRRDSAFGSPGGFPFPMQDQHVRVPHRLHRHHFFPRFPSTVFFYAPAPFYTSPVETASPVVSAAPVVTASPVIYVSPTVYVSTPSVPSLPDPAAVAPPAAPPLPTVVEHPTGRYELRGDGVGTPYVWVWIPNPPPAPPPSREEKPAALPAPGGGSQTYRWTDEEGTTFWTNRLEKIPEPYRSRALRATKVVTQQ